VSPTNATDSHLTCRRSLLSNNHCTWPYSRRSSVLRGRNGTPEPSTRLEKTQCSCSSGFSFERRPWIGSSVNYNCSLVTRGDVRSRTKCFKRITTWKRSSSLIGLEATVRVLWFQSPFATIDMQRGGVKPAPTDTEEMHHAQGQNHPHIRQTSCSRSSLRLIFLRCVPSCRNRRLQSTPVDQRYDCCGSVSAYMRPVSHGKWFDAQTEFRF